MRAHHLDHEPPGTYRQSLQDEARSVLEETRIILPGIQALFGFQLIAVFNEGLHHRLGDAERIAHLVAVAFIVLATVFAMTPAALHRIAEPHVITHRFVHASSRFITASMTALGVAITIDVFLVTRVTTESEVVAAVGAALAGAVIFAFWIAWPVARRLSSRRGSAPPGSVRAGSVDGRDDEPRRVAART